MTTITKKRVISLFLVLGILMPYLTGLFSHVDLTAKEAPLRTSETILDSKDAKVDVAHTVFQNEIQWEIAYEKKASSAQQPRRLKLAIDEIGHGLGTVRDLNRAADEDADSDGWYVMNDTYTSEKETGVLTFSTTINNYVEGAHFIKVAVQIDEEATQALEVNTDENAEHVAGEVAVAAEEIAVTANEIAPEAAVSHNENILMDHDAGPHTVHANSSAVESAKPEAEVVEVKPEAEAGVVAGDGGDEVGAVEDAAGNIVTLRGGSSFDTGTDNGKTYRNKIPNYDSGLTGVFPADGNSWVPKDNTTVINHSGGDNTSTEWNQQEFINYVAEGSTRTDYDFGISKWAQETTTAGLYDVYMEIFGNTIDQTVATPYDLVLLADRSGSMKNKAPVEEGQEPEKYNRWENLQSGVTGFMEAIKDAELEELIHVGYASFGSKASSIKGYKVEQTIDGTKYATEHKSVPIGSLALVDDKIGPTETDINSQIETKTTSKTPKDGELRRPGGATNTHAGLNAAKELIDAKEEENKISGRKAKTIVILLTDGVPTYSYEIDGANAVPDNENDGSYPDKIAATSYKTDTIVGPGNAASLGPARYTVGEGESAVIINNNFVGMNSVANDLKATGVEIRVIGIQLTGETHNLGGYTKYPLDEVETRMRAVASKRPESGGTLDGAYYYKNVKASAEIVSELEQIFHNISSTVSGGRVNDPIGAQLTYKANQAVSIKQVDETGREVLPEEANYISDKLMPIDSFSDNTLTLTNINLGANQRVQIKYQLSIDTEDENFVPDSWYPVNRPIESTRGVADKIGRATFTPTPNGNTVDFGVPSVMAPGVEVIIDKNWAGDSENDRPEQLDFQVVRSGGVNPDISGKKSLFKSLNAGLVNWTGTFKDIEMSSVTYAMPKFNNAGVDLKYTVTEIPVEGYTQKSKEVVGDVHTFVNELDFKPIGINVLKVSSEGKTPLSGAKFTLEGKFNDDSTSHVLTNHEDGSYSLPAGVGLLKSNEYTLTENTPPVGHSVMEGTVKIAVNDKGEVTWDGKPTELVNNIVHGRIENKYIAPQVKIRKYTGDLDKHYLGGAKFGLYLGEDEVLTKIEDSAKGTGLATFTNLKPGSYVIKEIAGPVGYDTRDDVYSFKVTDYGQVEYLSGAKEEGDDLVFRHQNGLKDFDLTILKIDDLGNDLKGASFKLEGPDKYLQKFDDHDSATFTFDKLNVGTYTLTETKAPNGYILAKPIEIVIDDLGNVTVNDDADIAIVVHSPEEKVNTISFKVDNKPKNPLPQTGGIGTAIFYLVGAIAIAGVLVNVQLKKRKGAN